MPPLLLCICIFSCFFYSRPLCLCCVTSHLFRKGLFGSDAKNGQWHRHVSIGYHPNSWLWSVSILMWMCREVDLKKKIIKNWSEEDLVKLSSPSCPPGIFVSCMKINRQSTNFNIVFSTPSTDTEHCLKCFMNMVLFVQKNTVYNRRHSFDVMEDENHIDCSPACPWFKKRERNAWVFVFLFLYCINLSLVIYKIYMTFLYMFLRAMFFLYW